MNIKMTLVVLIAIAAFIGLAHGDCSPACGSSFSCSAAYEPTGCTGWVGSQGGYSENQGCSADSAGGEGWYDNGWGPSTNTGDGYSCPCSASDVIYAE